MDRRTQWKIQQGLERNARRIASEMGISESEARLIVAEEMDGTIDERSRGGTVLGGQTCYELGGEEIPGVTGDDGLTRRTDPLAKTEDIRHMRAEQGIDAAGIWLKQHENKSGLLYGTSGERGK